MIEITLDSGDKRLIKIGKFGAMEGWDMQRRFVEFASSTDTEIRASYTMEVLAHAEVVVGDTSIALKTGALIENHLQKWENVEAVFETVLLQNGIDPDTHADRPNYWATAGGELAVSFIAEATKMIGPALAFAAQKADEPASPATPE